MFKLSITLWQVLINYLFKGTSRQRKCVDDTGKNPKYVLRLPDLVLTFFCVLINTNIKPLNCTAHPSISCVGNDAHEIWAIIN